MHFDFLICSERSGSNLIAKVMDGHPEVCGPFPSHMMRTFCPHYYLYGDLSQNSNWADLTEDVADYLANIFAQWESAVTGVELRENCPNRTLAEIIRYAYEKEARAQGKTRVFVKENHAYEFIPFTLVNFPQSRIVWLVRDPRDMALCQRDSILSGGAQTAMKAWKPDQAESLKVYGYLKYGIRDGMLGDPLETMFTVAREIGFHGIEFCINGDYRANLLWQDGGPEKLKALVFAEPTR